MEFPLPALTQQSFSRWYNKRIERDDNTEERIVYPGTKLACSTKSRDLRSQISPEDVFVTHEIGTNVYHHKVLGSNNVFIPLPKRLYSHCFRNINIHSIPPDNRIIVRLTETTSVTLPFIPDDFVAQKRTKRSLNSRTRPKRDSKKQKTKESGSTGYTGWVTRVLSPDTDSSADNSIDTFQLMSYVREEVRKNDNKLDVCVANPFSGARTIEEIHQTPEKQKALATIVQFVHHYGKKLL